ncbi:hypothetical protein BJV82DRAFT_665350 [Fennellomyces sp. T-0311]|nr:hypothetical protein BJV82DRAFT_665350 [Fennellomyces sp. T-0311]
MKLREPCERCGTKRFKKKSDGTLVCKNGHLRLGWQEEAQDEGMVYMGTRRKVPTQPTQGKTHQERFKGVDRETVNLQICQRGLNIAVEHCARKLHFPEQVQTIALYLWQLYVSTSGKTMDFDIFNMDKEDDAAVVQPTQSATAQTIEEELDIDLNVSDDEQERIENDERQEEEDEEYEWPAIHYSDIVVFLFLTFKWVAIPVLLSDVRRMCKCQQIPYSKTLLDIPRAVLRRVDKAYIYTTQRIPSVHQLYQRVKLYRKGFDKICGLTFPEISTPGLVRRLYPHLGLPDVFLGHALVLADKIREFAQSDKCFVFDKYDGVQAVVCLAVLVKLLYIFDDKPHGIRTSRGDYALPSAPAKDQTMAALRAELKRLQTLKQKSDLAQTGACQAARLAFLRDFAEALKGAGYNKQDIVLVGEKDRKPSQTSELQSDDLYLLRKRLPDARPPVEKSLAEKQLRRTNTVYSFAPIRVRKKKPKMSKEWQTVIELLACLIDMDIDRVHRSLGRFENYLKDDLLH